MKPREPRRNVMIRARMRSGPSWSDALILNLSSRGMLVRADRSPARGTFLEIRRGSHVIIARVVWSNSGRFGVQTQDPVPSNVLILDPDAAPRPATLSGRNGLERRATPRPTAVRHDENRNKARFAELAAFVLAGGIMATFLAAAIEDVLAAPLTTVRSGLAAK